VTNASRAIRPKPAAGIAGESFCGPVRECRALRLAADEALFLPGDPGNGCYLFEDGLLKVVVASNSGGESILALVDHGTIVGGMWVIDGRPRSASVLALRRSALKFLSRASFEEFTEKYPDMYKYLGTLFHRVFAKQRSKCGDCRWNILFSLRAQPGVGIHDGGFAAARRRSMMRIIAKRTNAATVVA
jgi:hypothetical protein